MYDHVDAAFTSYSNGHFSQYVWFDSCTFRGMSGFFPTSPARLSTPAFTGDTTNCFYMWRWSRCSWDSLAGGSSGITALRIGELRTNNTWIHAELDHSYFGDYSSKTAPSCYIAGTNVFGLYIHDDSLWNLGKNVASPVGHAALIFLEATYYEIYNCHFGPNNFGNCIRSFGQADIPAMFNSFSQWSVGYTGRSRIYNCIDIDSRKYPFYETRRTPTDIVALAPYVQQRTSAEVWFISAIRLNTWSPHDSYVASVLDCYEPDSLFLKGSFFCGPSDTVWGACGPKACTRLIAIHVGTVAVWDTANSRFISSAADIGLEDSTATYRPAHGRGHLYNQGPAPPAYIPADFYGNLRSQADIGAVGALPDIRNRKKVK
jgi:hypothetical protein